MISPKMERVVLRPALTAAVFVLAPLGFAAAGETLVRPAANSCAAHGPGFTRAPGSETCVKISGHIRVEAGVARNGFLGGSGAGPQSAPAQYAPTPASSFGPLPVNNAGPPGFGPQHPQVRVRTLPGAYPALR